MDEKKTIPAGSLSPLKLLVTVIDRKKADFYLDYLQSFDTNVQFSLRARGTAKTEMLEMLGLEEQEKAVLFSIIRADHVKDVLSGLEEKFNTVRNGKGIAFTIPFSGMIGVAAYQFLADNR